MIDPTPSTPTPPVAPVVVDAPVTPAIEVDEAPKDPVAAVAPVKPETPPEPLSWESVGKRLDTLDPELAAGFRKLHGDAQNEVATLRESAKPKPAAVADPLATILQSPMTRRMMGHEEGDPFEGIEVKAPAAPNFEELLGDVPEEALSDPKALRTILAKVAGVAYEAGAKATDAMQREFSTKVSQATYAPMEQARTETERRDRIAAAVAEMQKLPGMKDETNFKAVYAEMERRDLEGMDGFKAAWADLALANPSWMEPVKPSATATPDPVVVKRPAAPAVDEATRLSRAITGGGGARPPGGTLIAGDMTDAEKLAVLNRDPEYKAIMRGETPDGMTQTEAFRKVRNRLFGQQS